MFVTTGNDITLAISRVLLDTVPARGPVDAEISELARNPRIARQIAEWDKDNVRSSLKEYGAWDAKELSDDNDNALRLLWILVTDAKEEAAKEIARWRL